MGGKSNMIELIKQEPRDDGRDMIIPFSVTLKDGCLTVECEEGLVETAQEYERRFSEQPFSEEARRFVADAVEAETAGTHFSLDRSDLALDTVMLCYNGKPEALDRYILRPTKLLPESRIGGCENLTVFEADEIPAISDAGTNSGMIDSAELPVAAIVRDGKIISLAATNGAPSDGKAEISVDTAEDYRRQGYGRSCVAALTRELLRRGLGVRYVSFGSNDPSLALAHSIGFTEESRCFDAVCYRDEA